MNILQVTTTNGVYPPTTGGYHRMHGLVSEFPSMGDSVSRFCQTGPLTSRFGPFPNVLEQGSRVHIEDDYIEFRHVKYRYDVIKATGMLSYPIGWGFILRHHCPQQLKRLLSWGDIILNEGPYQVPALTELVDSIPVVYSSHNVEAEVAEPLKARPFGKRLYHRVRDIESRALEQASAVICTSERDKREFDRRYGGSSGPMIVIPNGVSRSLIRDSSHSSPRSRALRNQYGIAENDPVGLFLGSNYSPNIAAAYDVFEIANRLRNQDVSAHFFIIGSVGQSLSDSPENVTVTGHVENIEPYFDVATFALNPIRTGGGTNLKLLDYFARGLPVITTEFGARGFDLDDSSEAVIVNSVEEFVEAAIWLIEEDETATAIGERARNFVEQQYTWEAHSRNLRRELELL